MKHIDRQLAKLRAQVAGLCTRIGCAGARLRKVSEKLDDGEVSAAHRLLKGLLEHTDVRVITGEIEDAERGLGRMVDELGGE